MEDLGISPSSLSTSKSLRRKYNTIKSKSKAAAEASSKRRQEEEENNNTMMMDKLDVKTKIVGMRPKDNASSMPSGLTRTIRWRFVKRSNILCEHLDAVKCLSLDTDTSRLLSGSDDGLVKLWSLKSRSSKTLCTLWSSNSLDRIYSLTHQRFFFKHRYVSRTPRLGICDHISTTREYVCLSRSGRIDSDLASTSR